MRLTLAADDGSEIARWYLDGGIDSPEKITKVIEQWLAAYATCADYLDAMAEAQIDYQAEALRIGARIGRAMARDFPAALVPPSDDADEEAQDHYAYSVANRASRIADELHAKLIAPGTDEWGVAERAAERAYASAISAEEGSK